MGRAIALAGVCGLGLAGIWPAAAAGDAPATPGKSHAAPAVGAKPLPPRGRVPAHSLTGYWQNFVNGSSALRLSQVPDAYNVVTVAFADAVAGQPGAVGFQLDSGLRAALGSYSTARFTRDIAAARRDGDVVLLSIGGEKGNVEFPDAAAVNRFATTMSGLIRKYGFDGIDIDLEHSMDVANVAAATKALARRFHGRLVVTMAPQTLDVQAGGRYEQLIKKLGHTVDLVNTQDYNSGSMLGPDGKIYQQGTVDFLTALAAIQLKYLPARKVGLGLPAAPPAAGSGYVAPGVVIDALNCLEMGRNCGSYRPSRKYRPLGGVMTWSVNWDVWGDQAFSAPIAARLGR